MAYVQPDKEGTMDEILSLADIETRYDSEWILVEDPEVNEQFEVLRGKVVIHSKNRDEVYRKAADLKLKSTAFLYTGKVAEDAVIIL